MQIDFVLLYTNYFTLLVSRRTCSVIRFEQGNGKEKSFISAIHVL